VTQKSYVRITHVSWRGGRPRFEPGPALRKMGYEGRDLKDAAGRWLDLAATKRFSDALTAEVAQRRKAAVGKARGPRRPATSIVTRRLGPALTTVEGLFDAWFAHASMSAQAERRPGLKPKAPATIVFYGKMRDTLAQEAPEVWCAAAGALDRVICFNLYERLVARRGLSVGNGVMRVLSAALSFGIRRGLVPLDTNPCQRLGMETSPPRLRVAEPEHIDHLVAAADALDRPEVGDAIMLGVWTAQRQQDRLQLVDEGLLNGRRYFRQRKTGAIVAIPEAPKLTARLRTARQRRAAGTLQHLELVINERDDAPWRSDHYRHVFLAVRRAATHGVALVDGPAGPERVVMASSAQMGLAIKYLPGLRCLRPQEPHNGPSATRWLITPMPALDDLHDQDLRDTAVTWLARAGCTIPEIVAVTGHSLETATSILKHYLARHPELADHAIAKLVTWHG
jgi:hypothetical protein